MSESSTDQTILGIPINRVVLALAPIVATGAGALATWLLVHVHLLGLFHVTHDQTAKAVEQLTVFAITAGITWLAHQSWIKGHQIELAGQLGVAAAAKASGQLLPNEGDPSDLQGAHDHPETEPLP